MKKCSYFEYFYITNTISTLVIFIVMGLFYKADPIYVFVNWINKINPYDTFLSFVLITLGIVFSFYGLFGSIGLFVAWLRNRAYSKKRVVLETLQILDFLSNDYLRHIETEIIFLETILPLDKIGLTKLDESKINKLNQRLEYSRLLKQKASEQIEIIKDLWKQTEKRGLSQVLESTHKLLVDHLRLFDSSKMNFLEYTKIIIENLKVQN